MLNRKIYISKAMLVDHAPKPLLFYPGPLYVSKGVESIVMCGPSREN